MLTGRPELREAAPYYFTYIDQVQGDEPVGAIKTQLDRALPFLSTISQEKSLHRYASGKWSIRELLSHVTDTERAFAFRALWFARGFTEPLPGYDQDVAAAHAEAHRVAWEFHVEEFRLVRLATIALFRHLPPQAWMRSGVASEKLFTVRALAFIIPGHVTHHLEILRARYL